MRNLIRPNQTPQQYAPETGASSSRDSDIIADIIESLVVQENGVSRPPSHHHSFSFKALQPEDIERVRRDSRGAVRSSRDSFELSKRSPERSTERSRSQSHPESHSHDFVTDVFDTLQPSKHPSYPRPRSDSEPRNRLADSAVSVQHSKHESTADMTPDTPKPNSSHTSFPDSPIEDEAIPDPISEPPAYPSPAKTALIMVSLYVCIFLVALDRTIIGPAIPEITNHFHSTADIGWYGSAYMLTSCAFILLYGRIYTFFNTKYVFLSGIVLFEVGSAICGAASSSMMLIIGRAVAGWGSSGIFTGAILIMLNTVPLHRRPMLQGLFGACFGVASVTGPLLGGAFTGSKLTWRWCFYINLPLGGFTLLVVVLFLHLEEQKPKLGNWMDTVKSLDPVGTALFLPSITCLLLALEWGAAEYPWSSPRIIALLTIFAALFLAFIGWQYFTRHTTATIPGRVFFQRSVLCGGLSQFFVGSTMLTVSMYIPLWFQAIKNDSAIDSGIHTIPLVLSVVAGSISSGGIVQKIGYYTPFMILGSCFMAVGTGLLTTWNMSTPSSVWIGYQIILGLGVGFTMQHPNLAIQVVLSKQDIATGTALMALCQTLGGAVFVAVGQNIFINKFTTSLEQMGGLDPARVVAAGATDLKTAVPLYLQQKVTQAYSNSLTHGPFLAAVFVACLAVPSALGMEWRSVKEDVPAPPQDLERLTPDPERVDSVSFGRLSDDPPVIEMLNLPEPVFGWRKVYKGGDELSYWLSSKVNPDLKKDLREEMMALSKG